MRILPMPAQLMLASGFWSGEGYLDFGAVLFVLVVVGIVFAWGCQTWNTRQHRRSAKNDEFR